MTIDDILKRYNRNGKDFVDVDTFYDIDNDDITFKFEEMQSGRHRN
ncbi:MAG: hypothetical protein J1F05_02265 [Muribaculaceae bacterium]|nr:hypothetical protein [Muribaculaceae bacterium]